MKKKAEDSKRTMQVVLSAIGSFAVVTLTTSFLVSRYSESAPWVHARSAFTEAEKRTMFQRTTPLREALEAMAKMKPSKGEASNTRIVSPWAKPQP